MSGIERGHASDWDVYWKGTRENAAHKEGGPQEAALASFWEDVFAEHLAPRLSPRMLDIACGNGAVTGRALSRGEPLESYCVDYSASALAELRKRHSASVCVAADAARLPWRERQFDLVVSQFGLEYAGPEALLEAGRVVANGRWREPK